MNGSLQGIVDRVRTGTNEIATGSIEIAKDNMNLSSRTEQQASSLDEAAAATAALEQHAAQLAKVVSVLKLEDSSNPQHSISATTSRQSSVPAKSAHKKRYLQGTRADARRNACVLA